MATTIEELCEEVRASARREEFPIDVPVYERFKKDPFQPILYAGSLEAPVCIFGRDLGKDEVRLGQPLIGAGGKLVRQGVLRAWQAEGSADLVSPGELELRRAALRPSNQYGSLQAPRQQSLFRSGQATFPAADPRAAHPVLDRPSHHPSGYRVVPLVRALWRPSRVSRAAEVKHASTPCSHAACRFPAKNTPALKTSLSRSCRFPIHPL